MLAGQAFFMIAKAYPPRKGVQAFGIMEWDTGGAGEAKRAGLERRKGPVQWPPLRGMDPLPADRPPGRAAMITHLPRGL